MVSHESILWSHTRVYYGLIREDTMVSYERILWSHTRGYYGLIREDTMVSYEKILWSHTRGYYGLTWEDTMVYWWKIPSAMCRTAGSGSRRFRMSCKTLSHGIFLEISLSIDWFFSVVIDTNTSKAPPWLVRYAHKYSQKQKSRLLIGDFFSLHMKANAIKRERNITPRLS